MPKKPEKPKRGHNTGGVGVIYARYSSHSQKDMSIDQQVGLCRQLAEDCGIEIIDVYPDRAISGKSDNRPNFQQMMHDAAKGRFQYVISWKSSRIGRNMVEALVNENRLNEYGVRILYVEEDFDDTAAGRFAARSMMNVNQFYIENMAEDIKRGLRSNAENCQFACGKAPYGYVIDKNLYFQIDPDKAEIVKEIYERTADGTPFVEIARLLNARGLKTATGRDWHKSAFYNILNNERYRGIYIWGDIRKEGGIPRIISDELYFTVQEVLHTKKNAQGRRRAEDNYLLTGKLFCGECGAHMIGVSGTSHTGDLHFYYACNNKRTRKSCKKLNVKRDVIEKEVAVAIRDKVLQSDVIGWIADSVEEYQQKNKDNPELDILKNQLADVKIGIKNIVSAIEKGIITTSTKDRLRELETEEQTITGKISVLEATRFSVTREEAIAWLESFRNGDVNDKKFQLKLFNSFLTAAYLYDDNRLKVVFCIGGGRKATIDTSILDDIRTSDSAEEKGSLKEKLSPLNLTQTNHYTIRMVDRYFVLTLWLRK